MNDERPEDDRTEETRRFASFPPPSGSPFGSPPESERSERSGRSERSDRAAGEQGGPPPVAAATAAPGPSGRRAFLSRPPVSAALGGLVVGLFFWAAIGLGWIEGGDGDGGGTTVQEAARPLADPESGASGRTVQEIYETVGPGVVFIEATGISRGSSVPFDIFPNRQRERATGSGFVIDGDGRVLTNAHVVDGAERIRVRFGDDETRSAELVGQDTSSDLAVVQVEGDLGDIEALELADSDAVQVGDPVVAIGNPFGLDRTVTSGIVSALQRQIQAPNGFTISDVIQTDASINPGNSGGPLLDGAGRVIGINSQIATTGGGSVGIGFAVPSNTAKRVVEQLVEEGEVTRAYLGITGVGITEEISETFNLGASEGVLVQDVVDDGPAAEAGIQGGRTQVSVDGGQNILLGGDVIIAIDGEDVSEMEDVVRVVDGKEPGDEIEITYVREGDERTTTARLDRRPDNIAGQPDPGGDDPLPFDEED